MKKNIILLLSIAFAQIFFAQNSAVEQTPKSRSGWFDIQVVQHFGLNNWSDVSYVNKGFQGKSLTEFRGIMNIAGRYWGVFADMGIGVMPEPKFETSGIDQLPMPNNGTKYYVRDVLNNSVSSGSKAHFKMTFGLSGNIPVDENLTIMPYLGVGFMTMQQRECVVLLKEEGSNMQYNARYIWNCKETNEDYDSKKNPGYLNVRLNFKRKISEKTNLLLGLEYTHFLHTVDFYAHYSNSFNANIERKINVEGNRMNMLGISVGLSF